MHHVGLDEERRAGEAGRLMSSAPTIICRADALGVLRETESVRGLVEQPEDRSNHRTPTGATNQRRDGSRTEDEAREEAASRWGTVSGRPLREHAC